MSRNYLAYAPRGAGLLCAVVYLEVEKDVCGWWIGFKEGRFPSAFFLLENFFSTRGTTLLATRDSDAYDGWRYDYASSRPEIDPPLSIEDRLCHELERLQNAFAEEWLFFAGNGGNEEDVAYYRQNDLPVQEVNIKAKRLGRMDRSDAVWTYGSTAPERDVIDYLAPRWPLEYGKY